MRQPLHTAVERFDWLDVDSARAGSVAASTENCGSGDGKGTSPVRTSPHGTMVGPPVVAKCRAAVRRDR